jgi:hypothetical protein
MAESVQINPRIKLTTKTQLEAYRKGRGYSQGEVIDAALEAYFTAGEGDTQALLFQKVNDLGQGMREVVALLGTVIQHLERAAKPPAPPIATAAQLYPELQEKTGPLEENGGAPPTQSSWRALFGRKVAT